MQNTILSMNTTKPILFKEIRVNLVKIKISPTSALTYNTKTASIYTIYPIIVVVI